MAKDAQAAPKKTGRRRRTAEPAAAPLALPLAAGIGQMLPTAALAAFPGNPRVGALDKIAASMTGVGFFGGLVVQASTGRVLAGNHVLQAALAAGMESVPAYVVDCDDSTARRIVLVDNRSSSLARNDRFSLQQLLDEAGPMPGFSAAEIDAILAAAVGVTSAKPTAGKDGAGGEDTTPIVEGEGAGDTVCRLRIDCGTEKKQRSLVEHLTARKIKCRAVIE